MNRSVSNLNKKFKHLKGKCFFCEESLKVLFNNLQ